MTKLNSPDSVFEVFSVQGRYERTSGYLDYQDMQAREDHQGKTSLEAGLTYSVACLRMGKAGPSLVSHSRHAHFCVERSAPYKDSHFRGSITGIVTTGRTGVNILAFGPKITSETISEHLMFLGRTCSSHFFFGKKSPPPPPPPPPRLCKFAHALTYHQMDLPLGPCMQCHIGP